MFGLEEDSDDDLTFTPIGKAGTGLGSVFTAHQQSHTSSNNSKLTYRPPKQPQQGQNGTESETRNIEIKQIKENSSEESFEPMSNVHPAVKMATAVSAYKFENNGFVSLGKLGLAIIGKKESNCYQLLLYKGKQSPVAIANISPSLKLNVQPDNYANFLDERGSSFTVRFESQDVLINFARQVLLCKTSFKMSGIFSCDLSLGEGKEVELGDSLEVQVTSWGVQNQSIGQMVETTRNKDKGLRLKLGGKNFFSGLEAGIVGMKKGGRRFLIADSETGTKAYDVEVTKLKTSEGEKKTSLINNNDVPDDKSENIIERMAKLGQPLIQNSKKNSIDLSQDMPELEEVNPKSAFSAHKNQNINGASDNGFTAIPITNIRSDTPQSVTSANSVNFGTNQHYMPEVQNGKYQSQGSEFNMLMSETRMQNTEMRMNMMRMGDKVDTLLALQSGGRKYSHGELGTTNEDIMRKLDGIIEQNNEIKGLVGKTDNIDCDAELIAEENFIKEQKLNEQTEMLKRLEQILREKELQLGKVMKTQNEEIKILEQKLEEQTQLTENAQRITKTQINTELKKVVNSTAKLLMSRFDAEETFTGQQVQETIGQTMKLISEKLAEKYANKVKAESKREPPIAAVAPVPAEVEEWEAESDDN